MTGSLSAASPPDASTKDRPRLAIVANAPAPYRIAQHTRLARELTEVETFSLFKHEFNNQRYTLELPDEIKPVVFGVGEAMDSKNKGAAALKQWSRGGEIIRWIETAGVDALIVTGYNDLGLLRLIGHAHKRGLPCFMFTDSNVHGDRATGLARTIKNLYVPWVVRHLTGLLPCGRRGVEYYERYGADRNRCFYMPHEPDYAAIEAVGDDKVSAMRAEYGLKPERKYINFTARMAQVKRPDLLIEAFARIAGERPQWDLLMIGSGPLDDEMKARVPAGLKDRVVWAGFQDGMDRLAALYKLSHIYCLPSDYEPWAATVIEGCACGCAMVVSDVVGAAPEVVENGVNGQQFRSGSVDSLIEALLDVTANADNYRAASPGVSAAWRERGDPVQGVRDALRFSGVLRA